MSGDIASEEDLLLQIVALNSYLMIELAGHLSFLHTVSTIRVSYAELACNERSELIVDVGRY